MNRLPTYVLRAAIIAMGAIVLALCIFALPATWIAVPKEYPDHTYVFYCIIIAFYLSAVPFYYALLQAMKLLTCIDANEAFSALSVRALKHISVSALTISTVFLASTPFFYMWADGDDAPGLVIINMFLILAPFTIAIFAAVMQKLLKQAIDIKSENELTV